MPQEHVFTTLGLNQVQVWHILQQACGRVSNTIQKCHSSIFKAKEDKVGFFKTLEEIIGKFTWDQVIIDSQLTFVLRTHVYHP